MQIACELANFSLGEGDVLRRAMGKKEMEQMAKQREKFRQGALENGIEEQTSMKIFDKMEKFAAYGFNKSHAAAYGYIAYVTAYFKANYPREWLAALMTCDSNDLTKVAKFIRECQSMDIAILSPDVNEAGVTFVATLQGIRFAMSGIKGVGTGVVEAIVKERKQKGSFKNLYDFIKRIDSKKVGKKAVENLVEAGCFDFSGWSRDQLLQSVEPMFATANKEKKEEAAGVMTFFSLLGDTSEDHFSEPPEVKIQTSREKILFKEKGLLGFFLTGHPMDNYKHLLGRMSCVPLRRIESMEHNTVLRSAFLVESVVVRTSSKTQRKFAILMISDGIENYELPIWSDHYEEKHFLFIENQLLYAVLQVDKSEGAIRLSCRWIDDLTKASEGMVEECDRAYDRAKYQATRGAQRNYKQSKSPPKSKETPKKTPKSKVSQKLVLSLDAKQTHLSHILELKKLFGENRGKSVVQLDFIADGKKIAVIDIETSQGVDITPKLIEQLKGQAVSVDCQDVLPLRN